MSRPLDGGRHDWLGYLRPTGLVVAPAVLTRLGLWPEPQGPAENAAAAAALERLAAGDPWPLFGEVLGWPAARVAGAPGGPAPPDELTVSLRDGETLLAPTWAVEAPADGFQLLVRLEEPGVALDRRGALGGWEATPQQRFERLLRETGVGAGVLLGAQETGRKEGDPLEPVLRLVVAPKGEASGWLSWPLAALAEVSGRGMLAGLKLLLDAHALFTGAASHRLPALLAASRAAQAEVSTRLAPQVLAALHELLRGLDAAAPELVRPLAARDPQHLYEGLLTVLLRLIFILYAEDRELMPSAGGGGAQALYEQGYALGALHVRLLDDQAANPDLMDERRGAWGRLLALFRLVERGHPSGFMQARGGKLFDEGAFPFLLGRRDASDPERVLPVGDGCVLRVLNGLLTLDGERVAYRSLSVEQIGSVYETVMGFTVERAPAPMLAIRAGKANKVPVWVDLAALAAAGGGERAKLVKERTGRGQLPAAVAKNLRAASSVGDLEAALAPIVDARASPRGASVGEGTPILQPTDERRRTGSHYTPRSLSEPIVRHALEPAFARIGADATPAQVLDLKLCDPAVGSGALLVEACRQLAARLVRAWERWPALKPRIPLGEDDELHARRLVAQRCLYGVDRNPLALDLAKLSLWLATLARDHEFGFLDHALKCGDSLVGLSRAQIEGASWDPSAPPGLWRARVRQDVAQALSHRDAIRNAPDEVALAMQEAQHAHVERGLEPVRLLGDAVVATFFAHDKPRARANALAEVGDRAGGGDWAWLRNRAAGLGHVEHPPRASLGEGDHAKHGGGAAGAAGGTTADALTAADAATPPPPSAVPLPQQAGGGSRSEHPLRPFHWEIEFPEVFGRDAPGFDAIVGNPPFAGKNTVIAGNRPGYLDWLQQLHADAHGNADLAAHFFRRAYGLLRPGGAFGLIATNTIRQGDTRESGLARIVRDGGVIYRAVGRHKWEGEAAVVVSLVFVRKDGGTQPLDPARKSETDPPPQLLGQNRRAARWSWTAAPCRAYPPIWSRASWMGRPPRCRRTRASRSSARSCSAWGSRSMT